MAIQKRTSGNKQEDKEKHTDLHEVSVLIDVVVEAVGKSREIL